MTEINVKRNYGIDLLRIFSMLTIVILHIIVNNGLLKESQILTYRGEITWLIWTLFICGDICFALISGYVYIDKEYSLLNIVKLWITVEFYSVLFGILNYLIYESKAGLSIGNILKYFFPLLSKTYWYFSEYFLLYLLIPLLTTGINAMSKQQLKRCLIFIIFFTTIAQNIYNSNSFELNHGFSCMWLIVLFCVGAYIKKYNPYNNVSNKRMFFIYVLASVFSWLWQLINRALFSQYETLNIVQAFFYCRHTAFISLLSPTMIIQGVSLLILFSRLNVGKAKIFVKKLSSVSFSVYIIHSSTFFSSTIISWLSNFCLKFNNIILPMSYLVASVFVYLICFIIDEVRITLFKKLKVDIIIDKTFGICKSILSKYL